MGFKTIKITKKRKNNKRKNNKRKNNNLLKNFIIYSILGFFLMGIIGTFIVYNNYIVPLPNIKKLEEMDIKESSIIYDIDGNELYTLFGDEKRTYINYDKISQNMLNAIIAGEDKTFFTNPGIDFKGIVRALFNYITLKSDKIEGTSTISQQLIKNVFLSNERKLERKIKELYLSYQMTKNYSKEKILELYLNKISFGSNAFGIEQASRTFFGKNAIDLDILQASILASIPKGPTYYSPYNYFNRLVGNLYIYPKDDEKNILNLIKNVDLEDNKIFVDNFKNIILNLKSKRLGENGLILCGINKNDYKKNLNIDKDGCSIMNYSDLLGFLNSIKIEKNQKVLEYQTGRKDFILGRMFEDNYINFEEYQNAILSGIGFEFKEYKENIKHPHFVMYVREYLTSKYGEEILQEGGLKIHTTLNSSFQKKAEELIQTQVKNNMERFDANNAALISIDNNSGDIVAFVGGADYFNKDIDGNVNMITARRQPGSSFKPFVYALSIDKNQIGTHTPIYDLPTIFPGNYEPKNYNGKFNGKMTLMTALNHSRNIPAIKLYFLAGEQKAIIDYLKTAGVKSLNENFYYGAPLALGTGEMTPLEMAGVYSVFANMGNKVEINPILKIIDSKGNVIEEKKKSPGVKILDEKTVYIMNYILSATYSRPNEFWNTSLSLQDRQAGAKTGTSNKTYIIDGKKEMFPGDLWTAGYTPQYTTVVWAGNTDGKAIKITGDGLNGAAPIWKNFMEFIHIGKEKLIWKKPSDLDFVKVSKISGLLAPEGFEPSLTVESLFKNPPTEYDMSLAQIQVDALCNGKVGPNTPIGAIKTGYYVAYHSINPNNKIWEEGVQKWAQEEGGKEFVGVGNIITNYKNEECIRDKTQIRNSKIEISTNIEENTTFINGYNYVEISYKSINPLKSLQIFIGENLIQEIDIQTQKTGTYKGSINIPLGYYGNYNLTIRALDSVYLSKDEIKNIKIIQKDTIKPKIILTNPTKDNISIYSDQYFNLKGYIKETSLMKSINIYINGKPYKIGIEGREFEVEINKDILFPVGIHKIKIEAIDFYFNKGEIEIEAEIMQR